MNSLLLMLARHSSTENISLYALVEYNKAEFKIQKDTFGWRTGTIPKHYLVVSLIGEVNPCWIILSNF